MVCRYISGIVEPLGLQKLCIDIGPSMQADTVEKLKAIAAASAKNTEHVQELEIYNSEIATAIDDDLPVINALDVDKPFSVHVFDACMALKHVPRLL